MTEEEGRKMVIEYAHTWLGVRFRDQGFSRGGIDCGMLMIKIFHDCGIVKTFRDPRPYHPRWFMVSDRELMIEGTLEYAVEISAEEAIPGDVVIYKHGRTFSHSALIVSDANIIHAYFKEREVALCERKRIELTHYGHAENAGKPRPCRYFNVFKKQMESV